MWTLVSSKLFFADGLLDDVHEKNDPAIAICETW